MRFSPRLFPLPTCFTKLSFASSQPSSSSWSSHPHWSYPNRKCVGASNCELTDKRTAMRFRFRDDLQRAVEREAHPFALLIRRACMPDQQQLKSTDTTGEERHTHWIPGVFTEGAPMNTHRPGKVNEATREVHSTLRVFYEVFDFSK